jgi:hypothetical protein
VIEDEVLILVVTLGGSAMQQSKAYRELWPTSQVEVEARLARSIRLCVAEHLREVYAGVLDEKLPPEIATLLRRLDS